MTTAKNRKHTKAEQLKWGNYKGVYNTWDIYQARNYQGQWWAVSADGSLRINPGPTKRRVVEIIDRHMEMNATA